MASSSKTVAGLAGLVGGRVVRGGDTELTDVTHDSRQAHDGSLYVALRGEHVDGHAFVTEAVARGAAGVCVDHEVGSSVAELVVADTRQVLGELAAAVHDFPSAIVKVVGVTGTNGKTTVTHYVESIARHAGRVTGLMGTIHTRAAGSTAPSTLTTPEAPEFQRLLAEMRDAGVSVVAAEVSSHALELGRVRGTRFAVAAFTNLSQDHLDFHGDMVSYQGAKERLFTEYEVGTAVVNVADPVGAAIARAYQGELVTVGTGADVSVADLQLGPTGTRFRFETPWGGAQVEAPVLGEFNVANLAIAATCSLAVGIGFDEVLAGMTTVGGVPGRFEVVSGSDPITVIVDYAHTPEGVARAVETGRRLTDGRVIGLIGAGGDRDRAKRPAMGRAISMADFAVITSDNPRSEKPESIAEAVMSGVDPVSEHVLEIDRHRAIDEAIAAAHDGDVVLILGRGHEPFQDLGDGKIPFDDREVAAAALTRRRRSTGSGGRSGSITP